MIRLEDTHLFVEGGGEEIATLDESYALGTIFTVRLPQIVNPCSGWLA